MDIHPADDRVAYWAPQPVERARAPVRLERFPPAARDAVRLQTGPLANVRSSAGCAVVVRTDSPWIELALARLRHHQPNPVGVDAEIVDADPPLVTSGPDLRPLAGDVRVRLATGLERGGPVRTVWLWLPVISTAAVAGLRLAAGSRLERAAPGEPRWLAIGDSLTQGFCVQQPTRTWVHLLARRRDLPVWNLGVGGALIEPDLFAWALAARRFDLVTVGLGSNHAWRASEPAAVAARARALAGHLVAGDHGRIVWLLPGWKPFEDGLGPPEFMGVPLDAAAAARLAAVRRALREELARWSPAIEAVEVAAPRDHRWYPDGLHPESPAAAAYADALDAALERDADNGEGCG